ncbi:antitoxin [Polynucleobacter sp. UK-Gri1-W3]|jgi:antitoxin VapB|uniref:antitoxin n=1 Tax=Polynucleobacter sp. UK-Gri1-W3 TaxID=1819737 RepID=UPI00351D5FF8
MMGLTAKIFMNGRSQAIRLPAAFRFEEKEVFIRRDAITGDLILSRRPENWDSFFLALETTDIPADFLSPEDRNQGLQERDPFIGINE